MMPNKTEKPPKLTEKSGHWFVYIIHCSDDSLYTGITTDIEKRFQQHLTRRGAKYFRGRAPLNVVYQEPGHTRSSASKQEAQIKQLTHKEKLSLIRRFPSDIS